MNQLEQLFLKPITNNKETDNILLDSELDYYFSYNKDISILNKVNFQINKGETLGIIGSSGSGKTTLILLLLGLLKPTSGKILVRSSQSSLFRRRRTSLIV
jgi:ABC-type multidrug transport system fused ATPase/permease subunit